MFYARHFQHCTWVENDSERLLNIAHALSVLVYVIFTSCLSSAGLDDHLRRLPPIDLNLDNTGITHLDRVNTALNTVCIYRGQYI